MHTRQHANPTFTSASAPPVLSDTSTNARGFWSSSEKYLGFELREKERFERVTRRAGVNEPHSPFLPRTWQEHLEHRAKFLDDKIADGKATIAAAEEQAEVRRRNPASAVVVPAFGGRDLMGVASYSVRDYMQWRKMWWPLEEKDIVANRDMDGDAEFRRKGEFLMGEDLARRL